MGKSNESINDYFEYLLQRIFQCTQQPSSISCFDQSVTNGKDHVLINLSAYFFIYFNTSDRGYHPFDFTNNSISLPDIRVGLSRHHSIKQLHKSIID